VVGAALIVMFFGAGFAPCALETRIAARATVAMGRMRFMPFATHEPG